MRKGVVTLAFAVLIIGSCSSSVMGQGVTTGFAIHVGFVYPYFALYNMQVTVNDQTGRIIATGLSPDGSELIIGARTEAPTYAVTVRASGYASYGYYPYPYWYAFHPLTSGNPFWKVNGISTISVQTTGGDYWVTVLMTKG